MDLWSDSRAAHSEVDLVFFEVAGRTYGADVSDVAAIVRREEAARLVSRLGRPACGNRAIAVRTPGGEALVPIDRLVGFRNVPVAALRQVPPFARELAEPALVGFLLEKDEPLLLIDLEALVDEEPSGQEQAGGHPGTDPEAGQGRLGA